ncbi:uncharacterized protein PV07_09574 [Cladophialophora immunda]|uniref:Azaphilone pigments biosynthesis cluster protein L N-terminal domain-containing protein n=1 Tax=Cladophialophora immunda TaxID=569365 RepID=A0A0D2AN16_9EURO|nr:uncharacterized protein PV07_09574 [Cladophialophora immunda]KIW26482.1 hypothetical protein PV07_09574 [Cladophialophora immunda]OQV01153.1 hypothetical protein CLAIMM_06557 [Cladophialophora immunda]
MADPFSMAASILTVLQVADSIITFIRDLKNASDEHKSLLAEMESLHSVLGQVYEVAENAGNPRAGAGRPTLASIKEPLNRCRSSLEALMVRLDQMHGLDKARKALVWKRQRTDTRNLLADIEREKTLLMLALQIEAQTTCVTNQQLCLDTHNTITEMGMEIAAIKSLIIPEGRMTNSAVTSTQCQSPCEPLQHDRVIDITCPGEIITSCESFDTMDRRPAESGILPEEDHGVKSKRRRKAPSRARSRGGGPWVTIKHYGSNESGSNVVYGSSQVFSSATVFFGRA